MLNKSTKQMIENDIIKCKHCRENKEDNGWTLYSNLYAKYIMYDKNFRLGIPNYSKSSGSDYYRELEIVEEKLQTYIDTGIFPSNLSVNEAQNSVVIQGNNNKFKESVGQANLSNKENDVTINKNEDKSSVFSWIKKLFRRK